MADIRPTFKVDTNLFRELGELLVGRDSTALVELIKNSYDADASRVLVLGENLVDDEIGRIQILDDGHGMSPDQFLEGFLRIAGRTKATDFRRSPGYGRRFTGQKGIGRLASHKLARVIKISFTHRANRNSASTIEATIDWDIVEQHQTIDQLEGSRAIEYITKPVGKTAVPGTAIELSRLRKSWSTDELVHFVAEVQKFHVPDALANPLPRDLLDSELLFGSPLTRDVDRPDPGFQVILDGDFSIGEEMWTALVRQADWVVEIDAISQPGQVQFAVASLRDRDWADGSRPEPIIATLPHPSPDEGPHFQSRILIREGRRGTKAFRDWAAEAAGVRVYMEGFRVLPYGDGDDDWLRLEHDYSRRRWSLESSDTAQFMPQTSDKEAGLLVLPNAAYFGGVFLTESRSSGLKMLVNREGFVPEKSYRQLVELVRTAINLSVRFRAAWSQPIRERRRAQSAARRASPAASSSEFIPSPGRIALVDAIADATSSIRRARNLVAKGEVAGTDAQLDRALSHLAEALTHTELAVSEEAMIHIMASVGLQLSSFVHEVNRLLTSAQGLEGSIARLIKEQEPGKELQRELSWIHGTVQDLKRQLERQASYLLKVVTPDARRNRYPLLLRDRFEVALMLVEQEAARRKVKIRNRIDWKARTTPMFPAELAIIMANLLTNAVKFAGDGGSVLAVSEQHGNQLKVIIQNSGARVDLANSEVWFRPFMSTTAKADPILGQGMGLGLTITRWILAEYGGEVRFVRPTKGFETAIEILLPAG